VRAQPRIKGKRESLGAAVLHKIREAVEREARRHGCSMSFVQATVLAAHFGVSEQADYAEPTGKVVSIRHSPFNRRRRAVIVSIGSVVVKFNKFQVFGFAVGFQVVIDDVILCVAVKVRERAHLRVCGVGSVHHLHHVRDKCVRVDGLEWVAFAVT
jgi:hypothetical protein